MRNRQCKLVEIRDTAARTGGQIGKGSQLYPIFPYKIAHLGCQVCLTLDRGFYHLEIAQVIGIQHLDIFALFLTAFAVEAGKGSQFWSAKTRIFNS